MELRQLQTFVTAARLESFSKAAGILGYSQSAVTVQIRLLEEELGTRLFDRLGRRICLTPQGQRFLEHSQQILKDVNQAAQAAGEGGELKNPLHIGALESLCSSKLPPVLSWFRKYHPNVSIKITTAPPGRLCQLLDQNQVDLIYLLDRARYSKNWIKAMEQEEPIEFITSSSYWRDRPKALPLIKLLKEPFFLTEKNENYRRELDSYLESQNLELTPAVEVSNTDFIIRLLKENGGISYLPRFAVKEALLAGELTALSVSDLRTVMYQQVFIHKNKWKTREMEAFIGQVKACLLGDAGR